MNGTVSKTVDPSGSLGSNPSLSAFETIISLMIAGEKRYYIYVLKSKRDGNLYIGMTSELERRVRSHNSGKVRSTKARRPLKLIYFEEYHDKTEARKREIFLKTGRGRRFLLTEIREVVSDTDMKDS